MLALACCFGKGLFNICLSPYEICLMLLCNTITIYYWSGFVWFGWKSGLCCPWGSIRKLFWEGRYIECRGASSCAFGWCSSISRRLLEGRIWGHQECKAWFPGIWESVSKPARYLLARMLTRDVSSRITADEGLRHPWILFHTKRSLETLSIKSKSKNQVGPSIQISNSPGSESSMISRINGVSHS